MTVLRESDVPKIHTAKDMEAVDAVFGHRSTDEWCNNDKGGKTGTNGWTKLCGVDKKVPLGVILTNGPCQRILKILKREETWKADAERRSE